MLLENINLGTNNHEIRRMQVMDIAGRIVKDIAVQNSNISILTRGFKPGTYLVRLQGNDIIQYKIVVQ